MQFVKKIIIVGCLLILSNSAIAAALPSPTGYVNDFAGVLDTSTKNQLEQLLTAFEAQTGEEVALATIKSLDGRPIEDYAVDIYKTWGIGKKGKDNGVLILVAPADRQVRIEVGYGLEGVLNDAMAGRIIREKMIPAFKEGNLSAGIIGGTQTVVAILAKDAGIQLNTGTAALSAYSVSKKRGLAHTIFSVLVFILLAYLLIRHPWLFLFFLSGMGGGGRSSGGFGGGFGGFGGGLSGGGGASGRW